MSTEISEENLAYVNVVEVLIFASDSPLAASKIREIVPDVTTKEITRIVDLLNEQYRQTGRSFEIKEIGGGWQIFTLPEYSLYLDKLYLNKQKSRLTQKALETISIIAYKQPVTRHEIEEIRGVNVDGVMKTLLSRNLISISGRAQAPGGPFLYVTTKNFLDYFGLKTLEDLPKLKEIDELIDIEDERFPHHETILKEIKLDELGFKSNGEDESEIEDAGDDGKD